MAKIKNSHGTIQISQNQGLISFQLSMETIITVALPGLFSGTNGQWAQGQRLIGHSLG